MYVFIQDNFKTARGNFSRVLDVSCEKCSKHVAYYQKDGLGTLKRMYVDRFVDFTPSGERLFCPSCNFELGVLTTYMKENRPAYRLFQSSVNKKIVSRHLIK